MRIQRAVAASARLLSCLVVVGLAPVDAQAPSALPGVAAAASRDSSGLEELDGRLIAFGAGYKAELRPAGMILTPALGERAPHDLPLTWRVESIARGEREVWRRGTRESTPERASRSTASRALAAHVFERFEVRNEGVEVSYRFDRRLPGRGDLVVRVSIETALALRGPGDRDGLVFESEGLGGIRIGGVTAIDARGRRADGVLRPAAGGSAVELVVPSTFVDTASWPLLVDPLVGPEVSLGSGSDDSHPDIAYDAISDLYLVVFQRRFSGTDVDVWGQRVRRNGDLVGGAFPIASGAASQLRPRVANLRLPGQFLVVWQEASSPIGPFRVRGRAVRAANGATSSVIAISPSSVDARHPDVGGNRAQLGGNFCAVVWANRGGGVIEGARVSVPSSGTPSIGSPRQVSSPSSIFLVDSEPRISEGTDAPLAWAVAWSRSDPISDGVFARRIDSSAAPLGGELRVGSGETPEVDGDGVRFVVAWEAREGGGSSSPRNVRARALAVSSGNLVRIGSERTVAGAAGVDEWEPAIAKVDGKYLILWTRDTGGLTTDVFGLAFDADCRPCGRSFRLIGVGGTRARDQSPAVASQWSAGAQSDEAMIAFGDSDDAPPFRSELWIQRYEAFGGGSIVRVSPGCGSGVHEIDQPFALGNREFEFVLRTQASNALLSLSVGPPPPLQCGSCTVMGRMDVVLAGQLRSSRARVPLPIPCQPALIGGSIDFQWIEIGVPTSPCPVVAGLTASSWMRATIAY